MKHSEILRRAKEHLWDGRSQKGECIFICEAISRVGFFERGVQLQQWIQYMLYNDAEVASYGGWFFTKNGYSLSDPGKQAYRLQWMNDMIAYLEGMGK
jgi:hypothetical protein